MSRRGRLTKEMEMKDRTIDIILKTFAAIGFVSALIIFGVGAGYWWAKVGQIEYFMSMEPKVACGSCRFGVNNDKP
jgi:hypothetical protein